MADSLNRIDDHPLNLSNHNLGCLIYHVIVIFDWSNLVECVRQGAPSQVSHQPPFSAMASTPRLRWGRQRGFFLRQHRPVPTLRSISTCCARVLTYPHRRLHPPTERFAVRHYASSLGPTALSKWRQKGSRQNRYVYAGWYQDRFFGLFFMTNGWAS